MVKILGELTLKIDSPPLKDVIKEVRTEHMEELEATIQKMEAMVLSHEWEQLKEFVSDERN